MEKFKESLSKMMGLDSPPTLMRGFYTLKIAHGLENDQFRCGRITSANGGEKSWVVHILDMGNNNYVEWQVQGGETYVTARSIRCGVRAVVAVSNFFLDATSITAGELHLFSVIHPWAVSSINILADVIFKEHEGPIDTGAANHNNRN